MMTVRSSSSRSTNSANPPYHPFEMCDASTAADSMAATCGTRIENMMRSVSRRRPDNSDRWPQEGTGRVNRSAVADVTGQQPAPGRRYGVGAAGLRCDPVPLVDAGTGNFGGDHVSFTRLVRRSWGG